MVDPHVLKEIAGNMILDFNVLSLFVSMISDCFYDLYFSNGFCFSISIVIHFSQLTLITIHL